VVLLQEGLPRNRQAATPTGQKPTVVFQGRILALGTGGRSEHTYWTSGCRQHCHTAAFQL